MGILFGCLAKRDLCYLNGCVSYAYQVKTVLFCSSCVLMADVMVTCKDAMVTFKDAIMVTFKETNRWASRTVSDA